MISRPRTDVVVIGGGISGLWLRAVLTRSGYGVTLIDRGPLGDGQTMHSQGILHRGVKYAFSESAREASGLLKAAGDRWDQAMRGEGVVDLRGVASPSPTTYLWTVGTLDSLTAWTASKAMRSAVREVGRSGFPPVFAGAPGSARVWSVDEPVVDPGSLLNRLLAQGEGAILRGRVVRLTENPDGSGVEVGVSSGDDPARRFVNSASCVVCAAGEGNRELLGLWAGGDAGACQVRPLRMAMIDGAPFDLYGHCPRPGSDKPRLTVTTGDRGGSRVWYVGGDVAERGVGQSPAAFHDSIRSEIGRCLPWLQFPGARIASVAINRAEGRTPNGQRPDGPVVRSFGRVVAVWPTKLALAPIAADMAVKEIQVRVPEVARSGLREHEIEVEIGRTPWSASGVEWAPF